MATRRDLLEAETYGRRRLASAATAGSAGPVTEAERHPLRAVVVSVVLTLLLLAAAAVVGVLRTPPGDDADPASTARVAATTAGS